MGSSLTWEDFSLADLAPLSELAGAWTAHTSAMLEQAERVTGDVVGGPLSADNFDSDTAEECRAQLGRLAGQFEDDLHDYASVRIGATLDMLYETLHEQQENLKDLIREVVQEQFIIKGSPGSETVDITDRLMEQISASDDPVEALNKVDSRARSLQETLREIMDRARAADDEAAAVFDGLKGEAVDLPPFLGAGYEDAVDAYEEALAEHEAAQREEMLSGDAPPHEVAGWWASLSESERADIIANDRDAIRGLDGIPSQVRHDANMDFLDEHLAANPHDMETAALRDRIVNEDLMLLGFEPPTTGNMSYDRSGDWTVVLATGNPDNADNVGIYIPGTGSDNTWADSGWKAGTGSYIDFTQNIQNAADRADGGAENVTVMWLGSNMPDTVLHAAGGGLAESAGAALNNYTNGVNATNMNGSGAHVTHIGHSYGGVVASYADAHGTGSGADATVLVGAPGPGSANPHAGAFNVGGDNVYVMESPNDEIRVATHSPAHGPNPSGEGFGATVVESGEGDHMSYFNPGSDTVDELGDIMTGGR